MAIFTIEFDMALIKAKLIENELLERLLLTNTLIKQKSGVEGW